MSRVAGCEARPPIAVRTAGPPGTWACSSPLGTASLSEGLPSLPACAPGAKLPTLPPAGSSRSPGLGAGAAGAFPTHWGPAMPTAPAPWTAADVLPLRAGAGMFVLSAERRTEGAPTGLVKGCSGAAPGAALQVDAGTQLLWKSVATPLLSGEVDKTAFSEKSGTGVFLPDPRGGEWAAGSGRCAGLGACSGVGVASRRGVALLLGDLQFGFTIMTPVGASSFASGLGEPSKLGGPSLGPSGSGRGSFAVWVRWART